MEEIIQFKTIDGKIFDTKKEAENHEKMTELNHWYNDHQLLGNVNGSRVDWNELIYWIKTYSTEIKQILKLC